MSDLEKYRDLLNHESNGMNDELEEFLNKSANAKIPEGRGKKNIWNEIDNQIDEDNSRSFPVWTFIGVAASILLIATVAFFFDSDTVMVEQQTGLAESKTLVLPDGSKVTLNANSQIAYSEDWDRIVTLQGEGFFEVEKGGKFQVQTNIGTVEVLGTSFNVFVRDSIFEVACKTGKVNVKIPSKSFEKPLVPGDQIRLESDTVKQSTRITDLVGKWKTGEFYYSNQKLSIVLKEMERQFDVSVTLPDSLDFMFEGYFFNKNIDVALEMVCLPLGLTYENTGASTYVIRELE